MKPHGAVLAWIASVAEKDLFVSAVTIGEIQAGIERTRLQDKGKAEEIERWLDYLAQSFQVIPLNSAIFRDWAKLMLHCSDDVSFDALIAATARVHGLSVVTRNLRDFEDFGVSLIDPFQTKT